MRLYFSITNNNHFSQSPIVLPQKHPHAEFEQTFWSISMLISQKFVEKRSVSKLNAGAVVIDCTPR